MGGWLSETDLRRLYDHACQCAHNEPLGDAPGAEAILRHFRVTAIAEAT